MAIIGTFTATSNGFTGTIRTLTLNIDVSIERIRKPTGKSPQFRVLSGDVEIGAAWEKHSEQTGRDYLSVKIDDPSLLAPIRATLVEAPRKDVFHLTWFRIFKGD